MAGLYLVVSSGERMYLLVAGEGNGPEVGLEQGNTNISDYLNEIQPVKCEEHSRFIIHCGAKC